MFEPVPRVTLGLDRRCNVAALDKFVQSLGKLGFGLLSCAPDGDVGNLALTPAANIASYFFRVG